MTVVPLEPPSPRRCPALVCRALPCPLPRPNPKLPLNPSSTPSCPDPAMPCQAAQAGLNMLFLIAGHPHRRQRGCAAHAVQPLLQRRQDHCLLQDQAARPPSQDPVWPGWPASCCRAAWQHEPIRQAGVPRPVQKGTSSSVTCMTGSSLVVTFCQLLGSFPCVNREKCSSPILLS